MQLPFGIAPSILDTIFRIGKLRFWLLLIFLCSNYSVVTWFNQKASLNSFNSVLETFYCILWYAVSCALKKTKKLHISFTILRAWRHIVCVYMWSSLLFSFFFHYFVFLVGAGEEQQKEWIWNSTPSHCSTIVSDNVNGVTKRQNISPAKKNLHQDIGGNLGKKNAWTFLVVHITFLLYSRFKNKPKKTHIHSEKLQRLRTVRKINIK